MVRDRLPPWLTARMPVDAVRRSTRSLWFDAAVMLACVVLDTTFAVFAQFPQRFGTDLAAGTVILWVLQLAADVSLLFRRRMPLLVLGIAILVSLPVVAAALDAIPAPSPDNAEPWIPASILIAAYSAVVYARNRVATWALVVLLAVLAAQPWRPSVFTLSTGALFVVLPALLGLYVAARRRLIAALTDRVERAEREQLLLAEQARVEERLRLASAMHDVVSHRVSLMVLQAGALRMQATDEATRTAAGELRSAGGQALEELRELIGVLRTAPSDEPTEPVAAMAELPDLAELVAESRAVGVPVEHRVTDTGYPVPVAVGHAAYRVVQEALTNVRKHAPGAAVVVHVTYSDSQLEITVHNDAPAAVLDPELSDTGSGTGLAGLRQRVELLGGSLNVGAAHNGGFTVTASLPRHGANGQGGSR